MDTQTAKKIFDTHNGIMKTQAIHDNKICADYLAFLCRQGYVERIRHGYYQWNDERAYSEPALIAGLFPDAVLCRESALQYYGYTDRTPAAWYLAVSRKATRSRFKIDALLVKPVFLTQEHLDLGVETALIENTTLKIFNREHIICDCLRQENKMDAEVFNKAIQAYIQDPQKNVPQLMTYAKLLHAENKVRKMIGVWL